VALEVAGLAVELDPSKVQAGAKAVDRALKDIERASERMTRGVGSGSKRIGQEVANSAGAFDKLKSSIFSVQGALATFGLAKVAQSIVGAVSAYEQMQTSLVTVTGSAEAAKAKMAELQSLANETPFTLEGVTKAYQRLAVQGLDASTEALTAYGDIASSFNGKTVIDFVEAVADATQGQGRRLKEFGIDLQLEGDKARLVMGDTRVEVARDAQEIEKALIGIAQTRFGGAMERQAQTLAGTWSTLEDKAAALMVAIGEGGLRDALAEVVKFLTEMVDGSKGTAKELGQTLADAIHIALGGLRFLIDHLDEVKAALAGFLAMNAAQAVAGLYTAFTTAAAGAGILRGALTALNLTNPFGWIAIGVTLLAELWIHLDDVVAYLNELLEKYDSLKSIANVPKQGAKTVSGVGKGISDKVLGGLGEEHGPPEAGWIDLSWSGMFGAGKEAVEGTVEGMKAAAKQGRKKSPGPGPAGKVKPEVDSVAESLLDLKFAASEAEAALGLVMVDPADLRGLQIETELLEWKNALLRDGKIVTAAQAAEARGLIAAKVDAEAETERLKKGEEEHAAALKKAADEAERRRQVVRDDLASGALEVEKARELAALHGQSAREIAIETAFLERLFALKAQGITVDAKTAATIYQQVTALQDLNEQLEKTKAAEDQLRGALSPLTGWLEGQANGWQNFAEIAVGAVDQLASAFTEFLVTGEADFKQFAEGMKRELLELIIKQLFFLALKGLIAAATGGLSAAAGLGLGGQLLRQAVGLHDGGLVGRDASFTRAVSSSLFSSAPRYHSGGFPGLRPDEVPAILQKGERVLSRREVAAGAGGGGSKTINQSFVYNINTPDADSFRKSRRQLERDDERRGRRAGWES
jgi:lambda family phage tail tape measure protein